MFQERCWYKTNDHRHIAAVLSATSTLFIGGVAVDDHRPEEDEGSAVSPTMCTGNVDDTLNKAFPASCRF
jgi:hypothetical protein